MSKPFDEMIKKELVEATVFLKLEDKVAETAKDPKKPTNAEYVTVLEKFKADQEKANPDEAKSQKVDNADAGQAKESGSKIITPKHSKVVAKATMVADLETMVPVIITDHDTSVAVEDDTEARTVAVRWGNPVIGMTTVNIPLHGKMQYVQKGAIIRLKKVSLASHIKDADGKELSHRDRKRFSVSDTTGWTEAEFEAHAKEQALKRI